MSATVLRGALAMGAPSVDAVLAEHVASEPGGHACRACGHVYTDELPVCPAVVAARGGYPGVADRMSLARVDDQVTPLEALQLGQERIEARIDALAEAVDDAQVEELLPPSINPYLVDAFGMFVAAVVWTVIALAGWRYLPQLQLTKTQHVVGLCMVVVVTVEAFDSWVMTGRHVVAIRRLVRKMRGEAHATKTSVWR